MDGLGFETEATLSARKAGIKTFTCGVCAHCRASVSGNTKWYSAASDAKRTRASPIEPISFRLRGIILPADRQIHGLDAEPGHVERGQENQRKQRCHN